MTARRAPWRLSGRRCLVTGGSSGIGEAIARELAAQSVHVAVVSERADDLEEVVASIRSSGGEVQAVHLDLSDRELVTGLIERLESDGGPIDAVVNNAGIGMSVPIADTRPEDLRFLFEVNFFALASLCRQALAAMAPRKEGRIVNISSASARIAGPTISAYSASKAAVHGFTRSLRIEGAVSGVYATEVLPISVRTRFFENVRRGRYTPSGVTLTPEQVARCVVRCLQAKRPPAEALPYRPVRAAFALEAIAPNMLTALLTRQYRHNLGRDEPRVVR